ncbi:inositol monophosphatase family protein [Actinomadura macrotermitis]|uniref:Histidinol-phosphatase n=1 Tax=Actinomadura macrotermitis TaxID=2585200 RepID=A0A7K0C8Q5_9ACTN|nr:inositol monophosphatase family protein [Actinomadura macrotermitis]MQY09835.1 Histidinol-phosphatase [Actinomadura macrotermitis]
MHDDIAGLLAEAGRLALRWFRADPAALGTLDKGGPGGYDPVTEADKAVETLLRAGLAERFPADRVLGEEQGLTGDPAARRCWVIDPIDGTKAFVSGVPAWGILVGLLDGDRPVAGWMHQPYLGETFAAVDGAGTFTGPAGRSPLRTRATTALGDAVMYTTHPSMFATDDERAAFERISGAVRLQRFGGDCYSYCLLALGQLDLVVENQLHSYDIVPLIPIIEAAGGVVTDRQGRTPVEGGFVIAAATPQLHAEALAVLG